MEKEMEMEIEMIDASTITDAEEAKRYTMGKVDTNTFLGPICSMESFRKRKQQTKSTLIFLDECIH